MTLDEVVMRRQSIRKYDGSAVTRERQKGMLGRNFEKTEGVGAIIVQTFVGNVAGHDLHGNPDNELGNGWGCYDAGASGMLLQLKATELGFDTLVIGIRDAEALRTVLGIPAEEIVTAAIAVGKRKEDANRPPRKPLDEIVRFY